MFTAILPSSRGGGRERTSQAHGGHISQVDGLDGGAAR
jgi:hypothetical protein